MQDLDEKIVKKLLKLFVMRCKFMHAFGFLQFRKVIPDID